MHSKKNQETDREDIPSPKDERPEEAEASAEAPAEGGSPAGGASGDPAGLLKKLEAERAEFEDKYLRKVADYENFRKRMFKEKEDARLYATTELLVDLVSLLDDFDRAIASSEAGTDWKSLHDGVQMIQKAFLAKLEGRYGLKRYDPSGEEFDPERHEAMMMEKRDGLESSVVAECFMKGYALHDRIIRPAKVKVAMPADGGGAPSTEGESAASPQDGAAASN